MIQMFKKIVVSILLASMLLVAFSGCTEGKKDSSSQPKASESSKVEATVEDTYKLISKGKLVMGTNAEFPPFEFAEGSEIMGIDVEIVSAIAKKIGVELEIKNMPFDSLDSAMTGKTVDIVAAGLSITPERLEVYAFSDEYFEANQTIIVKQNSGYTKKDDLKNKKIGGQSGNTGIILCAEELTSNENIKGYNNGSLAVEAMLAGDIDAVIVDDFPAQEYKKIHGDNIVLIEKQFVIEQYALGIHLENKALLEKANEVLAEMKKDGSLQAIIDKYIK